MNVTDFDKSAKCDCILRRKEKGKVQTIGLYQF